MTLFAIKITAMVTMALDHMAYGMLYATGLAFSGTGLYVLYNVMRTIGRLSFPLFAFAVTEGYRHTKDFKKVSFTAVRSGLRNGDTVQHPFFRLGAWRRIFKFGIPVLHRPVCLKD